LIKGFEGDLAQKAPNVERKAIHKIPRNIPFGPRPFNKFRPNMGPIVIPIGRLKANIPMP
jgi:hypothetical protein